MGAAWYWTRAELRQRWRTWLSIALVVGIGSGLAMGSLAGARRTQSAYPRFLEQARPPDFTLDPDYEADSPAFRAAVGALPGVSGRSDAQAVALGEVVDGHVDLSSLGTVIASIDGDRFYERDRVEVTKGRMPEPSRVDEVLVSDSFAAEGIEVGDRIPYAVLDVAVLFAGPGGTTELPAPPGSIVELEVTGIGIFPERVVVEKDYAPEVVLATPALFEGLPESAHLWSRSGVYLHAGVDRVEVQQQIEELADELGGEVRFEDRADITERAQRAIRPYVMALAGIGIAGSLFVLLIGMQLIRRSDAARGPRDQVLVALSADRRQRRLCSVLPALLTVGVATLVAVATQVLVSPLTPLGPVRAVESDPGFDTDWAVTVPGFVLLAAVLTLPVLASRTSASAPKGPGGVLVSRAIRAGAPLPLVLGLGRATGSGDTGPRTTARSGMFAVGLSIVMLVAVATFATSLDHLIDHPEVHGWSSDLAVVGEGGYGDLDLRAMAQVDGVEALSGAVFSTVSVNDSSIPGMGMVPVRGRLHPPVVHGRAPDAPDEIALGRRSMKQIGVGVGDTVDVRVLEREPLRMVVVGIVVLPGLGPIDNDRPSLGEGAMFQYPPDMIDSDLTWNAALVDLVTGADVESARTDLILAANEQSGETDAFDLFRPADIATFAELGSVPMLLVLAFGAIATASLTHVLVVTARRWRRDRAVLAALGATPGQLRSATRWQAGSTVAIAVVVGSPIGAVVGRWAWRSLAEEIGIVPDPVLPAYAFGGLVLALFVVAATVTGVPERQSRRRSSSAALRAE